MAIYQDTFYAAAFQVVANGVPVNITGWQLTAEFRVHTRDPDPPLLTLTTANNGFTITDAANGKFQMQMQQEQTAELPLGHVVFDIMRTDTGAPNRLCGGRTKVKQAVTRL